MGAILNWSPDRQSPLQSQETPGPSTCNIRIVDMDHCCFANEMRAELV